MEKMEMLTLINIVILSLTLFTVSGNTDNSHLEHSYELKNNCRKCKAGYYAIRKCNQNHDTVCAPCPTGWFTSSKNWATSCNECSICGSGLFQLKACSSTHDVFCESCGMTGHTHSNAYKKFCLQSNSELMLSDQNLLLDDKSKSNIDLPDEGSGVKGVDISITPDIVTPFIENSDVNETTHNVTDDITDGSGDLNLIVEPEPEYLTPTPESITVNIIGNQTDLELNSTDVVTNISEYNITTIKQNKNDTVEIIPITPSLTSQSSSQTQSPSSHVTMTTTSPPKTSVSEKTALVEAIKPSTSTSPSKSSSKTTATTPSTSESTKSPTTSTSTTTTTTTPSLMTTKSATKTTIKATETPSAPPSTSNPSSRTQSPSTTGTHEGFIHVDQTGVLLGSEDEPRKNNSMEEEIIYLNIVPATTPRQKGLHKGGGGKQITSSDETAVAASQKDNMSDETDSVTIGVVVAVAIIAAIIFFVLGFFVSRRCRRRRRKSFQAMKKLEGNGTAQNGGIPVGIEYRDPEHNGVGIYDEIGKEPNGHCEPQHTVITPEHVDNIYAVPDKRKRTPRPLSSPKIDEALNRMKFIDETTDDEVETDSREADKLLETEFNGSENEAPKQNGSVRHSKDLDSIDEEASPMLNTEENDVNQLKDGGKNPVV